MQYLAKDEIIDFFRQLLHPPLDGAKEGKIYSAAAVYVSVL